MNKRIKLFSDMARGCIEHRVDEFCATHLVYDIRVWRDGSCWCVSVVYAATKDE